MPPHEDREATLKLAKVEVVEIFSVCLGRMQQHVLGDDNEKIELFSIARTK